jgi:hypothetical protein
MAATVLSLMVLTALALVGGAAWLWRKRGAGRQALLMLVLAGVIAVNIVIWAAPTDSGQSLLAGTPD